VQKQQASLGPGCQHSGPLFRRRRYQAAAWLIVIADITLIRIVVVVTRAGCGDGVVGGWQSAGGRDAARADGGATDLDPLGDGGAQV